MNIVLHIGRHRLGVLFAIFCLASVFRAAASGCSPATTGIISWWPGDGNASDIAGTNNGILQGGATASASGLVGQAFSFDGTNNSVQIPDSPSLRPTNLTVEAWVLFSSLDSGGSGPPQGAQYIVFKQNSRSGNFEGYVLNKTRVGTQDHLAFQVTSASGQNLELYSVTLITTNVWYHVAGVRGTNYTQLYINGILESQTNVSFPQDYGNFPLYFGTSGQATWDRRLKGILDEVSLYNRALSSSEIAAIYSAGSSGKCKAPGIAAQPQSQTVSVGGNGIFTVAATGFGVLSYQWQFNGTNLAGATATNLVLLNVQATNAGNYTVVVTNKLGSVTSAVAVLTVVVPPAITTQPQSLTNATGTTATFVVGTTGTQPLSYQWRFNGTNLTGATATNLVLVNVQPTNAGNYTVVVTNAAGAVTSAVAVLTVAVPPTIATQPLSVTNVAGTTATFIVGASGTQPLSYQWRFNGTNLTGATATNLVLVNVQPTNGGNYTVVVTNVAGAVTSAVAVLTVAVPPTITTQPQSLTNVTGTTATFIVAVSGTQPLIYQWQFNGTNMAGATSTNLVLVNVQPTNGGNYTVVVTNVAGAVTSAVAVLTVAVPPTITTQPQSQTNVAGTTATFIVGASGTQPLSYQWQFNGTNMAGGTSTNLVVVNVQPTNAGNYKVVVTNFAGAVTSAVAVLTVVVPPAITAQPQSLTNVAGTTATFIVVASGTQPLSYQWQFNGTNMTGATSTNLLLANVQPTNAGNYTVVVTNFAGAVTSAVAVLTVVVPPAITAQPQSLTNAAGTTATFIVGASGTQPLSYQWQFNGTNMAGGTSTNLVVVNVQPTNAGNYTVVVTNFAGAVTSAVAVLTVVVPPAITAQPQSLTNVAGTTATFIVGASGTQPLSYQWQFNGTNVTGAISTNLVVVNVQPTNAGNYTVVVTNFAGAATSAVAGLTVVVPPTIAAQPQSLTNIAGTTATFIVGASGTQPLSYQWQFNGTNVAGAINTNLVLVNVQPTNAGNYTVVVTNFAGAVTSAVAALTVVVPPTITAQPQSLTNVAVTTATFAVTASGTAPLAYQWIKNGTNVLSNGTNISGAQTPTVTISNVLAFDRGNYSVFITNSGGAVTSAVATLSVIDPAVITQPAGSTVTVGGAAAFAIAAAGTAPLSFQWQFNGTNLAGATGTNLMLANVQVTNAGDYTVAVTNAAGSVTSTKATLIVNVPAVIPDPNLNAAMVSTLGKCNLTTADLLGLTNLLASNASITNLTGLELAVNLTTLSVGGNSIRDLSPLRNLTRLTTAFLYNNLISDLSPLAGLTNLSYLELRWNAITNSAAVLSGFTNLTDLYLGGNSISNVVFLQNLSRLTFLNLDHNLIADLSPLASLTNLSVLDLSYNPLTNIAQVGAITKLTSLYLSGNSVSNLTFVTNLAQLNSLTVCGSSLTDLSPLAGLPNLSTLNLTGNPAISNYSVLSGLGGVTNLWLCNNSISNVAFLTSMSQLVYLNLDDNSISGLSPLAALTRLTDLTLKRNPVTNCAALSGLTNLVGLSLGGDQSVSDLTFLTSLVRLTFLDLRGNQIASLSPLAGLTNLCFLDLGWNPITNYNTVLAGLTGLDDLHLEGDSISAPTFLANLTQLTCLDLGNNQVADLSPLAGLTNLRNLDLGTNKITDLSLLAGLTNLNSIRLNENRLTDIGALTYLPKVSSVGLELNLLDLGPQSAAMGQIQALEGGCQPAAVDYQPQRGPPTITLKTTTVQGTWYVAGNTTSYLNLSVSDTGPPGQNFGLGAGSSNNSLVPGASLIPGPGTNGIWILPVTPTVNQSGTTTITLTATNDVGLSTNISVAMSVVIPQPVAVPDADLGAAIRSELGKPTGPLTSFDLLGLTYLTALNVNDLSGLEWAANLTTLFLRGNSISNLTSLQNLGKLTTLTLFDGGGGQYSVLGGLTNLTGLYLDNDSITNLNFLQNLVGLKYLTLGNNQIIDLSPLAGLTNLDSLSVQGNRLTGILPIQNLLQLAYVDVRLNLLSTAANSAAMAVIQTLLSRGVIVDYLPQRGPPVISAPSTWIITANSTASLLFSASDPSISSNLLTITASSSNPALVPNSKIKVSAVTGEFFINLWTVGVTPALNQTGTTTITLSATNNLGLSTNSQILVTVASPTQFNGQFVNSTNFTWRSSANAPWFGQSIITHDGVSAAQSGHIPDGGESWLETTFPGPGTLSFWWKVSSETNADVLAYCINQVPQPVSISGEVDWQQQTVVLQSSGPQTVRWRYSKDPASTSGLDAGWLGDVTFVAAPWLEIIGLPANGQCQLVVHAIPGNHYNVMASTNLATTNWSLVAFVIPTNTAMPVLDTNASFKMRFYRLQSAP